MNFGRAALGPAGAITGLKEGERLKPEYRIKDPEQYIGQKVMDVLTTKYGMKEDSLTPITVDRMKRSPLVNVICPV